MESHVPLSLSFDDKFDCSFSDDLITQFHLNRDLTLADTDSGKENHQRHVDNSITPSLHSITPTPLSLDSTTNCLEQDSNHDMISINSQTNVSQCPAEQHEEEEHIPSLPVSDTVYSTEELKQSPSTPPPYNKINVSLPSPPPLPPPPPPPPTPVPSTMRQRQQNNSGLLRRSSTFLRQKFFSGKTPSSTQQKPIFDDPTTSESDRTVNTPAPPCVYPPKPLSYCPVDPPTDDNHPRRTSFPTLVPWRKKSTSRRQSEPAVKGRRSLFF